LSKEEFDSTMDAVFTSAEGGFLSYDERKAMQEQRANSLPGMTTEQLYVFFDWGKSMDRTVRAVGYLVEDDRGRQGVCVLELKEYPSGESYSSIIDDLYELIRLFGDRIFMVGWDNTGVGRGIEDFIKVVAGLGIQTMPVEFSLENKSRLYTMFKFLAERNVRREYGVKIPFINECDKQLASLVFKKTSRGYLMVHHDNERDRDDYPDAIVGLCSLMIVPENAPITAEFV
jgi:hypothetical protein